MYDRISETFFYNSGTGTFIAGPNKTKTYQEKVVSPTTSQQIITPDLNYTALSQVTVRAVDNTIDQNITARKYKERC